MIKHIYNAIYWRIERQIKSYLIIRKIRTSQIKNLKLHFGCGYDRINDMINVDFALNKITDLSVDLNNPKLFPPESTSV